MLFLNDQVLTTPPLNMIPNRQPHNPLFVYGTKIFPWDQHGSSLPSWLSRVQFPCNGKAPPPVTIVKGDINMIGTAMAGIYDFLAKLSSKYAHESCQEVAYSSQELAHRSFLHRLA